MSIHDFGSMENMPVGADGRMRSPTPELTTPPVEDTSDSVRAEATAIIKNGASVRAIVALVQRRVSEAVEAHMDLAQTAHAEACSFARTGDCSRLGGCTQDGR